jgi:hypothetical protein
VWPPPTGAPSWWKGKASMSSRYQMGARSRGKTCNSGAIGRVDTASRCRGRANVGYSSCPLPVRLVPPRPNVAYSSCASGFLGEEYPRRRYSQSTLGPSLVILLASRRCQHPRNAGGEGRDRPVGKALLCCCRGCMILSAAAPHLEPGAALSSCVTSRCTRSMLAS